MQHPLTREEQWAYGKKFRSHLWRSPNSKIRNGELYAIGSEVVNLFSYDLSGDHDTSEDSAECSLEQTDGHKTEEE